MNEQTDDILDYQPKAERHTKLVKILYGFSFLLFGYWFISDFMYWPFTGEALLLGLILLLVITLIRFISKAERAPFEYAYFLGKVVLIAAVFVNFMNLHYANYFIYTSCGFFLLGLILLTTQRKNESD